MAGLFFDGLLVNLVGLQGTQTLGQSIIILGVSMRVFWDKINIYIDRLSIADYLL